MDKKVGKEPQQRGVELYMYVSFSFFQVSYICAYGCWNLASVWVKHISGSFLYSNMSYIFK